MDNKLALTTVVTLAYRESLLPEEDSVSVELIRELLDLIKVSDVNIGAGTEVDTITGVKNTVLDMCKMDEFTKYEKNDLLVRLRVNTNNDEKWYHALEKSLNANLEGLALLKSVATLRKKVKKFITQEKIGRLLRETSNEWIFKQDKIESQEVFLSSFQEKLEKLTDTTTEKDSAVMDEIDFRSPETIEAVTTKIHEINTGVRIWKTGHQGLNDMFQGGFREGETVVVGALPHMDKTGTTLSLFKQLAIYNEPRVRKEGKRPTLVRLTFEDPMTSNIQYLYQNIVFNDTGEQVDPKKADPIEMARIVREKLTSRGFDIRMAYVDPSNWSFRSLFNFITKMEVEGADVQVLMVDYLSMIPTTGCRQGPTGSDLQDLFKRVRNFCRSRGILFITPHQLSTQARELTKGQVSDETFLPTISNKGFWQDCKGLDREFDASFLVHIIRKDNDVAYKAYCWDKHRLPTIVESSKKYFFMQFPGAMPIPDDLGQECLAMRKIGRPVSNASADFFEMN